MEKELFVTHWIKIIFGSGESELERRLDKMATKEELQEAITGWEAKNAEIDTTLDQIRDRISKLEAGTVLSQEDLDALFALVDAGKSHATAVAEEAASLKGDEPTE